MGVCVEQAWRLLWFSSYHRKDSPKPWKFTETMSGWAKQLINGPCPFGPALIYTQPCSLCDRCMIVTNLDGFQRGLWKFMEDKAISSYWPWQLCPTFAVARTNWHGECCYTQVLFASLPLGVSLRGIRYLAWWQPRISETIKVLTKHFIQ